MSSPTTSLMIIVLVCILMKGSYQISDESLVYKKSNYGTWDNSLSKPREIFKLPKRKKIFVKNADQMQDKVQMNSMVDEIHTKKNAIDQAPKNNSNSKKENIVKEETNNSGLRHQLAAADNDLVYNQKQQPQLQDKPDQTMFFDTQQFFGLVDSPSNEFHVWHAPFLSLGSIWPHPKFVKNKPYILELSRTQFVIKADSVTNYVLEDAFSRYRDLIVDRLGVSYYPREWQHQEWMISRAILPDNESAESKLRNLLNNWQSDDFDGQSNGESNISMKDRLIGQLVQLVVTVKRPGRGWPHLYMNESYTIEIKGEKAHIFAEETWGALRALESFSQLVWQTRNGRLFVNVTTVRDEPRFRHRGLLIDTARHYIHKEVLLKNLDAMAYNKLNVMHWHMVDDQSFPFQSRNFPDLSDKGAYDRINMIYTYDDVKEVIEYARIRGIRVIPEFDTPAHTYSWGKSMPDLLTPCFENEEYSGYRANLNPARNKTFHVLTKLYEEILELFPDDYIHLGADEVGTRCWETNPEVFKLLKSLGLDRIELLVDYFFRRLQNLITQFGMKDNKKRRGFVVWQDSYDSGVLFKNGTIIQVWKGEAVDTQNVARAGHRVLYSSCWYLDRMEGGHQWIKLYLCDPEESYSSENQAWLSNILGGEACMWSEYQTSNTILERIWPLTSAVAERLWSTAQTRSVEFAGPRLEEMRCRMSYRGIDVGVTSGPGMCEFHNVSNTYNNYRARDIRFVGLGKVLDSEVVGTYSDLDNASSSFFSFIIFILIVIIAALIGFILSTSMQSHNVCIKMVYRNLNLCFSRRKLALVFLLAMGVYIVLWIKSSSIKPIPLNSDSNHHYMINR